MNTCPLAEQIQSAARIPADAAQFLSEYAISGDYSGGTLHIGMGEYGYEKWLYAVIYSVNGQWFIISGYRLPDGRFHLVDAARGQSAKSLRAIFCFERNCDYFIDFTPDYTPEAAPVLDIPPNDSEPGTVYVLMLDTPLGNQYHRAQFYIGWAKHLDGRLYHHAQGKGAAFTRAAVERGIGWQVVFTMPGTRADERAIKNYKCTRRWLQAQGVAIPGQAVAI